MHCLICLLRCKKNQENVMKLQGFIESSKRVVVESGAVPLSND